MWSFKFRRPHTLSSGCETQAIEMLQNQHKSYISTRFRCLSSDKTGVVQRHRRRLFVARASRPSQAPALLDLEADKRSQPDRPPPSEPPSNVKVLWKRLLRRLANLKLAIGELALICALSSIGTVIEQNKSYDYYLEKYPEEGPRVLGFVTAPLIEALQWDHIYTSSYFLALLALLAASLVACTTTTQWPSVKVAQRWRFKKETKLISKLPVAQTVPNACLVDLGEALSSKNYQVFLKDGALYAFKGLAGKLGPIGVHASMLAVMAGVSLGAVGGFGGSVMITEGSDALLASSLRPSSPFAMLPSSASALLHVDDFKIDYRADGSVRQFVSDLQVRELDTGKIVKSETVSVNKPLRYKGITAYQTDWSIAALTMRMKAGEGSFGLPFNLPVAELEGQPSNSKLFASFLPLEDPTTANGAPRGISILARDPRTVTVYDGKGAFIGVRRPGSGKPISVEGVELVIDDAITASGLELKVDPGVPIVYAGFGGMCITTVVSYLSHSQVWAFQEGRTVVLGGKSNRATFGFEREMEDMLEDIPEI